MRDRTSKALGLHGGRGGPLRRTLTEMAGYGRTLVAFSGGVDSSVVLRRRPSRARPPQGGGRHGGVALAAVRRAGGGAGVLRGPGRDPHTAATSELEVPGYRENGPQRCYFCKSVAARHRERPRRSPGYATIATGTNASDVVGRLPARDPGRRRARGADAAGRRRAGQGGGAGRRPPLGTATWDKPAAACMASRSRTASASRRAGWRGSSAPRRPSAQALGAHDLRVRDLGDAVRLEVDPHLVERAQGDQAVSVAIREAGFAAAPIRIEAFRSGSMNDALAASDR